VLAYNLGNAGRRLVAPKKIGQASLKFDNKIGRAAWIDEIRLEPITEGL
jgi:hypothetical protein